MRNRGTVTAITWLLCLLLGSMSVYASQDREPALKGDITLLKKAKEAIYEKEWDQAIRLIQQINTRFPGSTLRVEALYWQAYSLEKQGKKHKALKLVNKVIETYKNYKNNEWTDDAKILRIRIAANLIKEGFPQYRQYIMEAIQAENNEQTDLKMVALDALLRLDRRQALPILEKLYKESKDPEINGNIIFILRNYGEDKMISQLVGIKMKKGLISIKEIKGGQVFLNQQLKTVSPPRVNRRVQPIYPREALEEDITGDVLLKIVINKKGEVEYALASKKSHPLLAEAAVKAVRKWKFFPYAIKGKRFQIACLVTITFTINK